MKSCEAKDAKMAETKPKSSQIFLTPFVLAREATRLVDTDCGPATRARPLGLFAPDKILNPGSAYGLEILNHTHSVILPVTLIEMCQQLTGKG